MHDMYLKVKAELMRNELGYSLRTVAEKCGVSKSSVANWSSPRARVHLEKSKRGPRGLFSTIAETVARHVSLQPITTATDLGRAVFSDLGLVVSRSTIYKTLKQLNMSCKKSSRSRLHQPIKIDHPFYESNPFQDDAIMLDESGFQISDRPNRGWSPKGTPVPKMYRPRRKRLSLILAIDRHGVVDKQLVEGGVRGETIKHFISRLPPGRPILLDNCSVHKTLAIRNMCDERGTALNFIPPYSPWYNPVENAFAQAKACFRKRRLTSEDFKGDILAAVNEIKNFEGMVRSSMAMWNADRQVA